MGHYQCIIFIYSGHGDKDSIKFSDVHENKDEEKVCEYKQKYRSTVYVSFGGNIVANKIDAHKLFLMDTCNGTMDSKLIESVVTGREVNNVKQIESYYVQRQ